MRTAVATRETAVLAFFDAIHVQFGNIFAQTRGALLSDLPFQAAVSFQLLHDVHGLRLRRDVLLPVPFRNSRLMSDDYCLTGTCIENSDDKSRLNRIRDVSLHDLFHGNDDTAIKKRPCGKENVRSPVEKFFSFSKTLVDEHNRCMLMCIHQLIAKAQQRFGKAMQLNCGKFRNRLASQLV